MWRSHVYFLQVVSAALKVFTIQRLATITGKRMCGNKMPTRYNRGFYCRSYSSMWRKSYFYSHKTQLNIKLSLLQYYNIVINLVLCLVVFCDCKNKIFFTYLFLTTQRGWLTLRQILLLAQHVLGTTMPIMPVVFRAVVFKLLVWCGAEGYVSGHITLHTRPATWKPQHEIPQAATTV